MAVENIELVDRDYENCSKEAMPRQIKTRSLSFRNIVEKFRQFRIRRLERKMEKIVDKTLSSDYSKRKIADKLMSKSLKLARLEEKIRILQKENVPSKFVKSRAIKLRNYMMENTVKSAAGLYFVDLDDSDVLGFVSADESALNNPESIAAADAPVEVKAEEDGSSIDLASQAIDRKSLASSIDGEFSNLENGDESDSKEINGETISSVIGDSLSDVNDNSVNNIVIPENKDNNLVSALNGTGVVPEEEGNKTVSEAIDNPELNNNSIVVPEAASVPEVGDKAVFEAIDNPELNNNGIVVPEAASVPEVGDKAVSEAIDNPELNNNGIVVPEAASATEVGDKAVSEAIDNPELNNSIIVPEAASATEVTADDGLNKDAIERVINDTFVDVVGDDVKDKDGETTFVSPEEVSKVVGNNDTAMQVDSSESIEDSLQEPVSTVDSEDTKSDENAKSDDNVEFVKSSEASKEGSISSDEIKQFMDNAFKNISKSEVSVVNPKRFDADGGIRFKHHYTPMTDDEIAESRNKINSLADFVPKKHPDDAIANIFTSLGEASSKDDDQRSMPVIVESRADAAEKENEIADYTFEDTSSIDTDSEKDGTDAAIIDVSNTGQSKIDKFNELKRKVLELRQKSSDVSKNMSDAQTSAREIAIKAENAKKKADQSDADLQSRIEQLDKYCKGLEQDCENTMRETQKIREDIETNSGIIETQEGKYDENMVMISEIDRLMGSGENSGPRKK